MNLGLDHPDTAAQGFCCLDRFINGETEDTAWNRYAEFLQEFFTLIFVNLHALSLRLVELRAMNDAKNTFSLARLYDIHQKFYHRPEKQGEPKIHNYELDSDALTA